MTDPAHHPPLPEASAGRAGWNRLMIWLPPAVVVVLTVIGPIDRDLWLDEAFSFAAARRPWVSIEGEHGTMAVYYLMASLWIRVSEAVWWFRFLSTLTMAGAVLLFTFLVLRQYGREIGMRAAIFASASLLVVVHAGDARSYALVCLLVVGTWYALDRGLEEPRRSRWWIVHAGACALLPFAHGMAVLQLAVQGLVVLAIRPGRSVVAKVAVGHGLAIVILGVLSLTGLGNEGSGVWIEPPTWSEVPWMLQQLTSPEPALAWLLGLGALAGIPLALRAWPRSGDPQQRLRALQPAAWGVATVLLLLAVCLVRPSHLARYTIASVFGLALLLAFTSLRIDRISPRIPAGSIAVVLALLVGVSHYNSRTDDGWTRSADLIATESRAGDGIVFPTDDPRLPFEAAWTRRDRHRVPELIGSPGQLGSVHRFPSTDSLTDLIESTPDLDRLWVVSQPHRHVPDHTEEYLSAISSRFDEIERWHFSPSITVRLLELRPTPTR